ncbi:MAG: protein kinase [Deltaproteobacteria bacterium]|nr:protein kinase [Deltaproteobacteria bacterium]
MPQGDDERTVADRPLQVDPGSEATRADATVINDASAGDEPTRTEAPATESPATETPATEIPGTESLPSTEVTLQVATPPVAALPEGAHVPLQRITPARPMSAVSPRAATALPVSPPSQSGRSSSTKDGRTGSMVLLTTAVDALRNEEIDRTRLFIKLGWFISILSLGTVPFLNAPTAMNVMFCGMLVVGIVLSWWFYRSFENPANYTDGALLRLAVMSATNASIAVLFFGVFTATPGIIVIGIHFAGRTEAVRTARWILGFATVMYVILAGVVISDVIGDPGVLASDRELDLTTQLTGVVFVLASYVIAYVTARALRQVSLTSIAELQRATRLASQREALMDELREDLERALRVGGPGRYTDQTVGSYKLGIVVGRGAMGEVYEAVHVATREVAAVKLLRRELLTDPTQVARFLREAKATSALDSPHVVKILEAAHETAELPYLAMEMLQGTTLAEILREDPKLPPVDVLQLVRQVGSAIDAASAIGVVHRDLKPQNLYRIGELATVWKVLDFGVASLSDDTGTLTQGGVVGTPSYMAPEQAQGRRVDGRSDVYALAAVAYRALTGRHPFNAPDTPALLYAVVHKMPTRPRELTEDLPEDIDRWFALALAKSVDDRFQTCEALFESLHAALTSGLDPKLRKRADALIRKHPWD